MNNYEKLEGMVAATFTPLDENGDVNLSVIDKYADWIASTPIKGVFVCGTTGEFSSLTIDERKLILEKWLVSARKRFKVIAHVGSNCQRSAMELARHAAQVGADAIASIAPSFFKPGTVDELVDFFAPICHSAAGLPWQSDGGRGRRGAGLSACNRLAGAICMEAYAGRTEDQ